MTIKFIIKENDIYYLNHNQYMKTSIEVYTQFYKCKHKSKNIQLQKKIAVFPILKRHKHLKVKNTLNFEKNIKRII